MLADQPSKGFWARIAASARSVKRKVAPGVSARWGDFLHEGGGRWLICAEKVI
jgi:hypothetical protein